MKTKMTHSEAGKLGAEAYKISEAKRKQNRIDEYNNNPKLCGHCKNPIPYLKRNNKYCCHSCAAIHNNRLRGLKPIEKSEKCLFCLKPMNEYSGKKYCSRECMSLFWKQSKFSKLIEDGYDTSYDHRLARKYLIELSSGKCSICGLDTWLNKPMPLVLDHINGNSEDGRLTNLRVICNNCDALTDTYKNKNVGNGRSRRRKRYHEGKSY